jgi:hypothetical protein
MKVTIFRHWVLVGCQNDRYQECLSCLLSSSEVLTCSQIWVSALVDGCHFGYHKKFEKIKNENKTLMVATSHGVCI